MQVTQTKFTNETPFYLLPMAVNDALQNVCMVETHYINFASVRLRSAHSMTLYR